MQIEWQPKEIPAGEQYWWDEKPVSYEEYWRNARARSRRLALEQMPWWRRITVSIFTGFRGT